MRRFLTLLAPLSEAAMGEARKKKAIPRGPTPQSVAELAKRVFAELQSADYSFSQPSSEWVEEVKQLLVAAKAEHEKMQAREKAEAERYGDEFEPAAFDMREGLESALQAWWRRTEPTLEIMEDVKHSEDIYYRDHPGVERSAFLSLLEDEKRLAQVIEFGGLDNLNGMVDVLNALSNLADTLQQEGNLAIERWGNFQSGTRDVAVKGIPIILFYCKMLAAPAEAVPGRGA